jgi:DNA polymerase-3 subunit delta
MIQTWEHWQKLIAGKSLPPVCAFFGEEKALIDEAQGHIRELANAQGLVDFNFDRLSARNASIEAIVASAQTLPVMTPQRFVEISDAEAIAADDLELLEGYLAAPNQSTVLALFFQSNDARIKILKLLEAKAQLFRFERPKEAQMFEWAMRRAKRHKLVLTEDAASCLCMVVGTDLLLLERALEKLVLVTNLERAASAEDVSLHVAATRLEDAFALGRAVALSSRKEALASLAKLKAAREVPLRLLGMLLWQMKQVVSARILIDQGADDRSLQSALSLYGDRLKVVSTAARKRSLDAHMKRVLKLAELDVTLKSSRAPAWLQLERTIMQLCV